MIAFLCLVIMSEQSAGGSPVGSSSSASSSSAGSTGASLVVYNSTAFAGAVLFNGTSATVGFCAAATTTAAATNVMVLGGQTAVWTGQLTLADGMYLFGIDSGAVGYTRLWIDDHLLVDTGASSGPPPSPSPSPSPPPPAPAMNGWVDWHGANIDTDGHSMKDQGGDCDGSTCGGSLAKCAAKCDELRPLGCVAFVTGYEAGGDSHCYMRKLSSRQSQCSQMFQNGEQRSYQVLTRNSSCTFPPGWRPDGPSPPSPSPSPPSPSPSPSPSSTAANAKFTIPVPFFPQKKFARVRLEYTAAPGETPTSLKLLVNGSEVLPADLSPVVAAPERQYFAERAEAEVGWNTWLSGDMLTHALLPHGLAVQLAFTDATGSQTLSMLGEGGPKCDRNDFPATHGTEYYPADTSLTR